MIAYGLHVDTWVEMSTLPDERCQILSVLEQSCAASQVERWPELVRELRRLGIPSRFSKLISDECMIAKTDPGMLALQLLC